MNNLEVSAQLYSNPRERLEIEGLQEYQIYQYWDFLVADLNKHPEQIKGFTAEGILRKCIEGDFTLWAFSVEDDIRLIIITEVRTYPQERRLRVNWIFGRPTSKYDAIIWSSLEALARNLRAHRIVFEGRSGWTRRLAKFNVHPVATMFEKIIDLSERAS